MGLPDLKRTLAYGVSVMLLFSGLQAIAATDGTVTFTVRTINFNTSYDPNNIMAIWVVDGSGNFVKTLKKRAATREQYLYRWIASSNRNVVDAITGATLSGHQTHTVTWNCRNVSGTVVPDGTYRMRVEYTMQNGQGPYTTNYCQFVKAADGYTTNYPALNNRFADMTLTYAPVTLAHDIAVVNVSPLWGAPNSSVPLNVLVTNIGAAVESFTVRINNDTLGAEIGTANISNLGINQAATAVISWNTTPLAEGTYSITATAGPVTEETSTTDNSLQTVLAVRNAVYDIAVSDLQCASLVAPGQSVPVNVTVHNYGDYTATSTLTVRDATDNITIGSRSVANLAPSAASPQSFSWNTTGRSQGYHQLIASVSSVSGETDFNNNTNILTMAIGSSAFTNTLISVADEWTYNDQGLNLHNAPWNKQSYYDGDWLSGPGPLGYGGDGEATVLSYGPNSSSKYPTCYFRKTFMVGQTPLSLRLRVRRDDGVVLYLNGTEVARSNMPVGLPTYQTLASTAISGSGETTYFQYTIADPSLVQPGINVLAAEVHQAALSSSDLGFDASLAGVFPDVPLTHDIALAGFSTGSSVLAGDRALLHMRVKNNGNDLESFSVAVQDETASQSVGSVDVDNLAPGESRIVSLTWQTLNAAAGKHSLVATAGPVSGESYTGDNTLTAVLSVDSVLFKPPVLNATGSIGGYCAAVGVNGSVAYMAEGTSLTAVDISTPASPGILGRIQLPGIIHSLATANGWIFAACGPQGLFIVDAAAPAAMQIVQALDTSGDASGLALNGNTLYLADGVTGVRIINVANPASASVIGSWHTEGPAKAVAYANTVLYVLDGHNGLEILNVSAPAAPVLVGNCDLIAMGISMAVSGTEVYIGDGEGVLSVVNASSPAAPVLEARVYLPAPALSLAVSGSTLFAPAGSAGLVIADISTLSTPGVSNTWSSAGDASGIAINSTRALLAAGYAGLQLLDISAPFSPTVLSTLTTGTRARNSVATQDVLYIAAGTDGVKIFALSNPQLPAIAGYYTNALNATDITIVGDRLYVADGENGLNIALLSSLLSPAYQANYNSVGMGFARLAAGHGNSAFISDGFRLEQIDVSTPASPTLRSVFSTNLFMQQITVGPSNVYIAAGSHGILILNYTDSDGMTYAGRLPTSGSTALGVSIAGNRLYIADDAGGWLLADAKQASTPTLVKTSSMHLPAYSVAASGRRLNVLDAQQGLHSYDTTLSLTPVSRDVIEPLAHAVSLSAFGKFVYVAQDDAGAAVIDIAKDDTDFDGLPDSLEQQIIDADPNDLLTSLADVLPGDDFDGDFLSNFAEFIAGTDATDPLSVFAVRNAQTSSDGSFVINWSSVSNRTYAVYKMNSTYNGFTAVTNGIAATPPLNSYTVSNITSNGYYTIIIE